MFAREREWNTMHTTLTFRGGDISLRVVKAMKPLALCVLWSDRQPGCLLSVWVCEWETERRKETEVGFGYPSCQRGIIWVQLPFLQSGIFVNGSCSSHNISATIGPFLPWVTGQWCPSNPLVRVRGLGVQSCWHGDELRLHWFTSCRAGSVHQLLFVLLFSFLRYHQ